MDTVREVYSAHKIEVTIFDDDQPRLTIDGVTVPATYDPSARKWSLNQFPYYRVDTLLEAVRAGIDFGLRPTNATGDAYEER